MGVKSDMDKKHSMFLSATSVLRYKEPQSGTSRVMTQFIHDYSNFQKHTPDKREGVLVESTQGNHTKGNPKQSINPATNRSMVFGPLSRANLGGGPDEPGNY